METGAVMVRNHAINAAPNVIKTVRSMWTGVRPRAFVRVSEILLHSLTEGWDIVVSTEGMFMFTYIGTASGLHEPAVGCLNDTMSLEDSRISGRQRGAMSWWRGVLESAGECISFCFYRSWPFASSYGKKTKKLHIIQNKKMPKQERPLVAHPNKICNKNSFRLLTLGLWFRGIKKSYCEWVLSAWW